MATLKSIQARKVEKNLVALICFLLCIKGICLLSVCHLQWPFIPGLIGIGGASIFFTSLQTAFLLYNQSKLKDDSSVAFLASGYLATSFLAFAYVIFLPEVLFPSTLLPSNTQASAWIWTIWHAILPISVILYSLKHKSLSRYQISQWFFKFTPLLTCIIILIFIYVGNFLPALIVENNYAFSNWIEGIFFLLTVFSLILLFFNRGLDNRQDLWLMVAIALHGIEIIYGIAGQTRYSIGWYMGILNNVLSSSIILGVFIYQITVLAQSSNKENDYLKNISEKDSLTGIANRRKFDKVFEEMWKLSSLQEIPLCLILIDVDNFKKYNDALGHPAGDKCLKKVAQALEKIARRTSDLTARIGGEEFAILLFNVDNVRGTYMAEEARKCIEDLQIPCPSSVLPFVTISVGYGSITASPKMNLKDFLETVDKSLYKAKKEGKNRIEKAFPLA